MIRTLNLNREITSVLENAYSIGYEKQSNAIWQASFSLPLNDPKVNKVELLKYVEITDGNEYIGLFRIIPKLTVKNESTQEVRFQCEHVLATLLGSVLFKYHQLTNYTTKEVLQYLINQQKVKHWKLGRVDFVRYFHYSWENENLLSAMFSVPKPFDEQYRWTWDTTSYPWTLNLVRPETEPTARIREKHNLIGLEIEENPMSVFNRIYPLGAGEGVNQLTIESVNNGVPYIEDSESIAENEIIETVWVDKRFEDPQSLKANAEALLKKWKEPIVTWRTSAADVSKITGAKIDELKEGKVVRLQIEGFPTTDLRIMKESKSDMTGKPWDVKLEIGNVSEDLGTTNADLERRQQINELYSQGATNILNFTYQDNCDNNIPALIPFYIDDDVVNVNTVELTFRTKKFRAYSRATEGGGAIVKSTSAGGGVVQSTSSGGGTTATSSSGGGTTATSSSGGGTSKSTESGGSTTKTSSASGDHRHLILKEVADFQGPFQPIVYRGISGGGYLRIDGSGGDIYSAGSSGNHQHDVTIPAHTHNFSTPNHTHSVVIPSHTHTVQIPNHSHEITIPNHTHDIELPNHTHNVKHEIVELNTMPSKVIIKVDGNTVPYTSISGDRINLVDYMAKDNDGRITRGRHEIEIFPDGLARIEADLICRVFIRSQLGEVF